MQQGSLAMARAARNEALSREVNERLDDALRTSTLVDYLCECADASCSERVKLYKHEYEYVRAESDRFFVLPEHVVADVDRVVEVNERFWVVEKVGEAGRVAEHFDPRRRKRLADG